MRTGPIGTNEARFSGRNMRISTIVNQFVETGMNTDGVVKAALLNAGWQPLMRSNPGSTVRRLRTNFSVK